MAEKIPSPTLLLSVSCVGSNGLQQKDWANDKLASVSFQYPVSDRMGCNFDEDGKVKSFTIRTFSILCRIEWVVTSGASPGSRVVIAFQYPVSDRMGCNSAPTPIRTAKSAFQYPVSDRMGCNDGDAV